MSSEQSERTARSIARGAALGVSQEARRRDVKVDIEDHGAGGVLVQYVEAVQQILLNLLLNAIEFSPPRTKVTLSLRYDEDLSVVFSVSDQGPGIEPERVSSILSSTTSTREGGAGLGLRYSSGLARSYGGKLVLERATPGACFALRWPNCEMPSSTRHPPVIDLALQGARLLLVEDDAAVCSLIEVSMEARGATIVTARSSVEFSRIAGSSKPFDAALVDLSPIADDVAGALRTLRKTRPGIPIILISGVASGVPDDAAGEVAAWVRKPFEMGEVVDALRRVITPAAAPALPSDG
jgi:CheY-like chemotaxis protein